MKFGASAVLVGAFWLHLQSSTMLAQASAPAGVYTGTYICGRIIGLQLTLQTDGSTVSGQFAFYEPKGSPSNPTGVFRVSGTFDARTRAIKLQPGAWVKAAPQWTPAPLTGTLDAAAATIRGTIVFPSCTTFEVRKEGATVEEPAAPRAADRTAGLPPERVRAVEERIRREQEARRNAPTQGFVGPAPEEPKTSVVTKIFELELGPSAAAGSARALNTAGYRRGDMIGPIYDGRFEFATAGGIENIRYFAQAFADLAGKCKNLNLEPAKFQIAPYLIAGAKDVVQRVGSLKASNAEMTEAVWFTLLQLNQYWSCQYNPSGIVTRDQAQANCNAAGRATTDLTSFASHDAAVDMATFLGRHSCTAPETNRLARQLIEFARLAHMRLQFTAAMPAPESPSGKAYSRMFENCARRRPDNEADGWCGCYVRTLHKLNPSGPVLEDLSNNPFADGATYMIWVAAKLPGGEAVYDCSKQHPGMGRILAQRITACLVDQRPQPDGTRACTYRAAWGEFTMADASCRPALNSDTWGYREVDCTAGGRAAAPRTGAREWNAGSYHMIDYEHAVADTFVPDLPPDARARQPLTVRFLKRETPGLLREMGLSAVSQAFFRVDLRMDAVIGAEIAAIDRENAMLLTCSYAAGKGLAARTMYWFEKVPAYVSSGRLNKALSPHPFNEIRGAATKCPAQRPPG